MSKNDNINFILTREQAKDICEHYEKNIAELEDWQICELLDDLIGEALFE